MGKSFLRMRAGVLGAALGVVGSLVAAGSAFATEPTTYSVTPITESIGSEITANLPVILGVIGTLLALSVVIHFVRKFAKT